MDGSAVGREEEGKRKKRAYVVHPAGGTVAYTDVNGFPERVGKGEVEVLHKLWEVTATRGCGNDAEEAEVGALLRRARVVVLVGDEAAAAVRAEAEGPLEVDEAAVGVGEDGLVLGALGV